MKMSLLLSALALTAVFALSGQEAQRLPDGEGRELVSYYCAGCHELDRVAAYKGTEEDWGGIVYTMRARGLEVTAEESQQIVAYLAKAFPPAAKKAAAPLPDGDGKDLVMEHCGSCHGLDQVQAHSGTKEDWEGVVKYMTSLGHAAKPEENARIVAYLAKNFPPAKPAPTQPK